MIREVMPWKATDPACVTVIRATEQRWTTVDDRLVRVPYRLSKRITEDAVEGYAKATWFSPTAWRLDGVDDFPAFLTTLEPCTSACVIRGVLRPEFAGAPEVVRRLHDRPGEPAPFVEVPRIWAMIDVEHLPNPGIDPTDPVLAGGAVRMHLPPPFRVARCVSQLSSQAGLDDGLRCHLWFVFDRALVRAELVRWLKGVEGVDLQVFVPVQPHYIAAPVFDGVDDPCS